jgi:pimeloyl-ACP methyl ester carboxylesterase
MQITVNNIRLHVSQQGGTGPTLLFLHYWGGSSRTWRAVIDALPAAYHSVAPDLRGWGDSDAADNNAYALADFAADVEQLIAALDLKQYVLVGHSMGGKIAQLLASRRPAGLQGLVLVAPAPPTPLALPPEARIAMESAYNSAASVGISIDHMLSAKPLSAAQREQVISDSLRGAPQARVAWPNYTSRKDISDEVTKINVPTIVIAGEMDKVDPVPVLRAEVLTRIPQSVLHVLPGTGHLSPLESARDLAKVIENFVSALPQA